MPEKSSHPSRPAPPGAGHRLGPLKHHHLDQVMAIERACFSQPWERRLFEGELIFPRALCLASLAEDGGLLSGYLIMWLVLDEAQVQNLAVDPARRGQGVGGLLLDGGLALARRKGATWASLEVRPSNTPARRLYASRGFREVGRRPGYYQPEGEDALLLNADLAWPDAGNGENP